MVVESREAVEPQEEIKTVDDFIQRTKYSDKETKLSEFENVKVALLSKIQSFYDFNRLIGWLLDEETQKQIVNYIKETNFACIETAEDCSHMMLLLHIHSINTKPLLDLATSFLQEVNTAREFYFVALCFSRAVTKMDIENITLPTPLHEMIKTAEDFHYIMQSLTQEQRKQLVLDFLEEIDFSISSHETIKTAEDFHYIMEYLTQEQRKQLVLDHLEFKLSELVVTHENLKNVLPYIEPEQTREFIEQLNDSLASKSSSFVAIIAKDVWFISLFNALSSEIQQKQLLEFLATENFSINFSKPARDFDLLISCCKSDELKGQLFGLFSEENKNLILKSSSKTDAMFEAIMQAGTLLFQDKKPMFDVELTKLLDKLTNKSYDLMPFTGEVVDGKKVPKNIKIIIDKLKEISEKLDEFEDTSEFKRTMSDLKEKVNTALSNRPFYFCGLFTPRYESTHSFYKDLINDEPLFSSMFSA